MGDGKCVVFCCIYNRVLRSNDLPHYTAVNVVLRIFKRLKMSDFIKFSYQIFTEIYAMNVFTEIMMYDSLSWYDISFSEIYCKFKSIIIVVIKWTHEFWSHIVFVKDLIRDESLDYRRKPVSRVHLMDALYQSWLRLVPRRRRTLRH